MRRLLMWLGLLRSEKAQMPTHLPPPSAEELVAAADAATAPEIAAAERKWAETDAAIAEMLRGATTQKVAMDRRHRAAGQQAIRNARHALMLISPEKTGRIR